MKPAAATASPLFAYNPSTSLATFSSKLFSWTGAIGKVELEDMGEAAHGRKEGVLPWGDLGHGMGPGFVMVHSLTKTRHVFTLHGAVHATDRETGADLGPVRWIFRCDDGNGMRAEVNAL